jgi:hypothetical protein
MRANYMVNAQHVTGDANRVSDILSSHYLLSHSALTAFFHSKFANQIPPNFCISPLPSEIVSWVGLTQAKWTASYTGPRKPQTKKATSSGSVGSRTLTPSVSEVIHTSTVSQTHPHSSSSSDSYILGVTGPSAIEETRKRWQSALYAKPLATWHRNSGITIGLAPATTRTEPTSSILD